MPSLPGWVGPSYQPQSPIGDAERTVNLYPEIIETENGVNRSILLSRWGLSATAFITLPTQPVRGLFYQDGRLFAVAGNHFYEITYNPGAGSAAVFTDYGTIQASGSLASMATNGTGGHQVMLVSGGNGYIFDLNANTLTQITASSFINQALQVSFVDGYFVVVTNNSNQFQISVLEDGTTWSGIDVAQRSSSSDKLTAMVVNHREIWLFGSKRTEVWWDTGAASFPFAPVPGAFIEQGAFTWSPALGDNTIFWVGQTDRGAGRAFRADGYLPIRVSTHAVEYQWQTYPRIDDVETFFEDYTGHEFWVVNFPTAQKTWAYDVATKLWHERDWYNDATNAYEAALPRCHAYAFGLHLVGDRRSGNIWVQAQTNYSDGPTSVLSPGATIPIRRRRRSPIMTNEKRWVFYKRFQVDAQVGDGISGLPNQVPLALLRWSNNGGRTFGGSYPAGLGLIGQYDARAYWNRLGRGRARVFEVEISESIPVALVNAYVELEPGTS